MPGSAHPSTELDAISLTETAYNPTERPAPEKPEFCSPRYQARKNSDPKPEAKRNSSRLEILTGPVAGWVISISGRDVLYRLLSHWFAPFRRHPDSTPRFRSGQRSGSECSLVCSVSVFAKSSLRTEIRQLVKSAVAGEAARASIRGGSSPFCFLERFLWQKLQFSPLPDRFAIVSSILIQGLGAAPVLGGLCGSPG